MRRGREAAAGRPAPTGNGRAPGGGRTRGRAGPCTAVAGARVGPVVRAYLARLGARPAEAGLPRPPSVLLGHGGVASVEDTGRPTAGTASSSPARGVAAAALSRAGAGWLAVDVGT